MIDWHLTLSTREKWLSAAKLGKPNNQDRAQGTHRFSVTSLSHWLLRQMATWGSFEFLSV